MAEVGDFDALVAAFVEGLLEMFLSFGFTMYEENLLEVSFFLARNITDQFLVVAVARQRLDAAQVGTHLVVVSEDGDMLVAAHNLGTEGLGLAIADTEDCGPGVVDIVGKMMFHAAGLHHARGGDDDAGLVADIEGLGGLDGLHILETVEAEGVGVVSHVVHYVVVEALGVHTHDVGGVDAERAVDEDIDIGEQTFVAETVEGIDDFLGAADSEGGDDELAPLLGAGVEDGHEKFLLGIVEGGMEAVAVG